jgi:hypothetical protein
LDEHDERDDESDDGRTDSKNPNQVVRFPIESFQQQNDGCAQNGKEYDGG